MCRFRMIDKFSHDFIPGRSMRFKRTVHPDILNNSRSLVLEKPEFMHLKRKKWIPGQARRYRRTNIFPKTVLNNPMIR